MDQDALNQRCIELLLNHPTLQSYRWHASLFWEVDELSNPTPAQLTQPKVDLQELEVMLATAAGIPSVCLEELRKRRRERVEYIVYAVHRGVRPLLLHP